MDALIATYRHYIQARLEAWKPPLVAELSAVLARQLHPDVTLLHVEFFDDSVTEPFFPFFLYTHSQQTARPTQRAPFPSARAYFESADAGYFSGRWHFLHDHSQPLIEPDVWQQYATATDYQSVAAESELIHAWFVDCWKVANGPMLPINTYLIRTYAHDYDEGYDLRRLQAVTWREVWE